MTSFDLVHGGITWLGAEMQARWSEFGASLIGLLFPPHCAGCGQPLASIPAQQLCQTCQAALRGADARRCKGCATTLSEASPLTICGPCAGQPRQFAAAAALGDYHAALRDAVLRTKRPAGEPLALALGKLLAEVVARAPWSLGVEIVVPIPMHWRRRLRRGVNGPDILAEQISRELKAPVLGRALRRRRHTQLQSGLRGDLRLRNVRRAFDAPLPAKVAGRHILLVDDVLTTGATCDEAARVLRQNGAAWVGVAMVARAAPGQ